MNCKALALSISYEQDGEMLWQCEIYKMNNKFKPYSPTGQRILLAPKRGEGRLLVSHNKICLKADLNGRIGNSAMLHKIFLLVNILPLQTNTLPSVDDHYLSLFANFSSNNIWKECLYFIKMSMSYDDLNYHETFCHDDQEEVE